MTQAVPTLTDPKEIHALAGKLIEFLEQQTASSLELQVGALAVASSVLQETVRVNMTNAMQGEVRNFWRNK